MYKNLTGLVVPLLLFGSVHVIEGSLKVTKSRAVERSASETRLLEATKRGDLNFVKNNLMAVDVRESDDKVRLIDEALLCACALGHPDIVRMLIHLGADVNIITDKGTPVSAAARGGQAPIIELLVDYDADVNEPRVFLPGEDEQSDELWAYDRERREENSPIIIAAQKGDFEVMKTLISAGASVNVYSRECSPIKNVIGSAHGARRGDPKASLGKYMKMLKLLTRSGADLTITCGNGVMEEDTPLHYAVELRFTDMVKFLLKEGASPNAVKYYWDDDYRYDSIKASVLWTAIEKTSLEDGSIDIIKLLLEAGADAQYQFGALRRALRLLERDKPVEKAKYLLGLSYLLYPTPKSSYNRVYWALRSLRPLFPPYVVVEILRSEKSLMQDVINFFLIELKEGRGDFLLGDLHGDKESKIRWILFSAIKQDLISYLEKNGLNMMDACWHELDLLGRTPWNRVYAKKPEEAGNIKAQFTVIRSSLRPLISQGIEDRCKELKNSARVELSLTDTMPVSSIVPAASISNKRARITLKRRIMII